MVVVGEEMGEEGSAQFFLPRGLTDEEADPSSVETSPAWEIKNGGDKYVPQMGSALSPAFYQGTPVIFGHSDGYVLAVPEGVSEVWKTSPGREWVAPFCTEYPQQWSSISSRSSSAKSTGSSESVAEYGAGGRSHKESCVSFQNEGGGRSRRNERVKARRTAGDHGKDVHGRTNRGQDRHVSTGAMNASPKALTKKVAISAPVKKAEPMDNPRTSSQPELRKKETQKHKKKSKKSQAGKEHTTADDGKKTSEVPRVGRYRDLEDADDSTSDMVADAVSRVEAHRQEWARKLETAAETFGTSFARNGHMHRSKGRDFHNHTSTVNKMTAQRSKNTSTPSATGFREHDRLHLFPSEIFFPGCRAVGVWLGQLMQVIIRITSLLLHNIIMAIFTILRWHLYALASVLLDLRVSIFFGFLYFLPSVLNSVDVGLVPPWTTSCLWYVFLVQFFFCGSSNGFLSFAQVVLPFAFLASSGKAEEVLVQMNGGERLLVAYVLSSVKIGSLNRSLTYISVCVQMLMTFIFGGVVIFHWVVFLIGSATIYPVSETKRRFSDLQAAIPTETFKAVVNMGEDIFKRVYRPQQD